MRRIPLAACRATLASAATAQSGPSNPIVRDPEYCALEAQHGPAWALPPYRILRQMLSDVAGNADLAIEGAEVVLVLVLVRLDDNASFGFLIEHNPAGEATVFVPGAPFGLSGTVIVVESGQIEHADLAPKQIVIGLRRLDTGLRRSRSR